MCPPRICTLQVKGLRKRKNGRWETQIMHKGKRHYLGTFDTAEEALEARNRRARELSITGATLPNKTPGPNRSKRGTAQPGPMPAGGIPVAAVRPSVPAGHAQAVGGVVYTAPAQGPLPVLLHDEDAHQQGDEVNDIRLCGLQQGLDCVPHAAAAVVAPHSRCELAGAVDAGYSGALHVSGTAGASHMYDMPQPRVSYGTSCCPDEVAVQSMSPAMPSVCETCREQLHLPGIGGSPSCAAVGLEVGGADAVDVIERGGGAVLADTSVHGLSGGDAAEMGTDGAAVKVCIV